MTVLLLCKNQGLMSINNRHICHSTFSVDYVHKSQILSHNPNPIFNSKYKLGFQPLRWFGNGRRKFIVYSVEPGASPSGPPPNILSWVVAVAIAIVIPFITQKWGPLIKDKVESALQTAEDVAEAVEKVAGGVEKVAEDIAENLPKGGKLREAVDFVEKFAERTAKDAGAVDDFIDKEEGHNRSGCQMKKVVEDFMLEEAERAGTEVEAGAAEVDGAKAGAGAAGVGEGADNNEVFAELALIEDLGVEEMTQPSDYPHYTQEDDTDIEPTCNKKPTTRQGRQKLRLMKKTRIDNKDGQDVVTSQRRAPTYSISSSTNVPPPVKLGIQIRVPPPMAFHPQHFIGDPSSHTTSAPMKVFSEGGKKFVTLFGLKEDVAAKKKKQV